MAAARMLVLALLFGLCTPPRPAGAQTAPPPTMAFVVGIEHYKDTVLDGLIFAAGDARRVHGQLQLLTELHPASTLLLAEDGTRSLVTAQNLRDNLEVFVSRIENGAHVVIYLGGHGTLSSSGRLWYLPSDYIPATKQRAVPFAEIAERVQEEVEGRQLIGVRLTFLVNMCGAGNAEGSMSVDRDDPALIERVQRLSQELRPGRFERAILPAAPRNQNTFEDRALGSSRFAHHLLNGLRGAAAGPDGVISAARLLDHIEAGIGEALPRSPDFAGNIVVGVTRRAEGEADYLVGLGLLAATQALEGTGGATELEQPGGSPTVPRAELSAQRALLRDLAREHLTQVDPRHPGLRPRASLRRAQAGLEPGGEQVQRALRDAARSDLLAADERRQAAELAEQNALNYPTLTSLHRQLRQTPYFRSLIVNSVNIQNNHAERDAASWQEVLMGLGGATPHLVVSNISSPNSRVDMAAILATIRQWRLEDSPTDPRRERPLVVVSTGVAYVDQRSQDGTLRPNNSCYTGGIAPDCRVWPMNAEVATAFAEAWQGPLALISDVPFGGYLLTEKPRSAWPMPIFVAASEHNGMTFGGGMGNSCDTSVAMARVFRLELDDEEALAQVSACHRQVRGIRPFVAGTPRWVPDWRGTELGERAVADLAPLAHFAFSAARGCATRSFAECDMQGQADALLDMRRAAELDLGRRNPFDAAAVYEQAARTLRVAATPVQEASREGLGASAAAAAVNSIAEALNARAGGVADKEGRRVVILSVAAEDYVSPLVADVPHALSDVTAYAERLRDRLAVGNTQVEVRPAVQPRLASDFMTQLAEARASLAGRSEDLLVLVFSGRGIELDGRRYLATSGLQVGARSVMAQGQSARAHAPAVGLRWDAAGLVDLWDIARVVGPAAFVGIYDAQFTTPLLDPERGNQILDKHVDSVRPRPLPVSSAGPATVSENVRPVALARGTVPDRQVHIWLEGRLTQSADEPPHACLDDSGSPVASPLAGALLRQPFGLPGQSSYRDWLTTVARDACLSRSGPDATLVFQGDLDVPPFTSGRGAQFVGYFQTGLAQRDLNLRAAAGLAGEAAERFRPPRFRLSRAALYVALAQLHDRTASAVTRPAERDGWLVLAQATLDSIRYEELLASDAAPMWAIRMELMARVHSLRGDTELALRTLRGAEPVAVLAERRLAARLVTLTEEVMRRQPEALLDETRSRINELPGRETRLADVASELERVAQAARSGRGEAYRIGPRSTGQSSSEPDGAALR
ncbi:caspase family protein [Roseomonas sp. 18066]|uniref:caspase family protein n=1 Tax=Roseomonas sp. 18066 TaxID=2681412 RepID=UPI0013576D26|nr:caspase family protein [Roseomonas sp. 18066]